MSPPVKADDRHLRTARWPWIGAGAACVLFIVFVLFTIFTPTADVWTDDAYVQVHYTEVSPRISGTIVKLMVTDNQPVQAGQVLLQLDDKDETTALHQAQAQVQTAQAGFDNEVAMLARQPALIDEAQAQVSVIEAQMILSRANKKRFDELALTGAGSAQQQQQADSVLATQEAQLAAAKASLVATQLQTNILKASLASAQATIAADQANLAQAQLNLSYARITAPLAGTVDALSTQIGNYITPGTVLMTIVPLHQVYIIANYRETALRHILPGQQVKIHLDAYNIDLNGVVEGLPPTTGAVYSPVPSANATGNFTKIVQRLPVKILVVPGQPLAKLLRAGLSVETTIHTNLTDVVAQQNRSAVSVTSMPTP